MGKGLKKLASIEVAFDLVVSHPPANPLKELKVFEQSTDTSKHNKKK